MQFQIIDNRGSRRDLLPHEYFTAQKIVHWRGRQCVALSADCSTRFEAEQHIENWKEFENDKHCN